MKKFLIPALLAFTFSAWSQRQKIDPISFGIVKLAEDRMPIVLEDFQIKKEGTLEIEARLVKDSVQWVRLDKSLLVPRALIDVSFKGDGQNEYSWEYAHQKIIPVYDERAGLYKARIFLSLFESLPLQLMNEEKIVSTVRVSPTKGARTHLIDYSCAPYSVKLEGIKDDFLSVGCKMQRTGKFGEEKPYLEVLLTSASYRLKDQSEPPYLVVFHETGEAKVILSNHEGKEEIVKVSAELPKRMPRLRLAAGFGPYQLESFNKSRDQKNELAPTAMLYGNFYLNESTSLRFFDSYTKATSKFHNWGMYFAWDLAEFCDQRCVLTSLIGVQGVDYRYDSNDNSVSDIILPQGFEFVYKHPFDQLNYKLTYGMFASFSGLYDYNNIWLRYGKSYFWELNFIEWRKDNRQASMFGLSIGFPIGSLF